MTGCDPNLDGIIDDFVTESSENLDLAIDDVLSLEQGPNQEAIDRIFRVVHTIKGTAGMLNFTELSEFVHCLEDTCSDIRSGDRKVDKLVTDGMLGSLDFIQSKLDVIRDSREEDGDYSLGKEYLQALQADDAEPLPCSAPETETPQSSPEIKTENADRRAAPSVDNVDELLLLAGGKRTCRTLIVEDEFMSRKLLYSFLSRFSICHVAKDGCEAIQAVTESYLGPDPQPFSLIFMDIQMPIIDGLRATRAIRAMEDAKGTEHGDHRAKIFIASSMDDHATIRAAIQEYGADVYLNKPLDLKELKELLIRHQFFPSAPTAGDSPPRTVELDLGMVTDATH